MGGMSCGITEQCVDPFLVGDLLDLESKVAQSVRQRSNERTLGAGQMVRFPGGLDMRGDVADCRRANIGGGEVQWEIDVRGNAGICDEPYHCENFSGRVPDTAAVVANNVERPVDGYRESAPRSVPEHFLSNEVALDITHREILGICEWRFLGDLTHPRAAETGEHRGGGDVMQGYAPVKPGEADELAGLGRAGVREVTEETPLAYAEY